MATVVRRYQRVLAPLTVQLTRLLPAGAFVSSSAPLPGEFVDLSLNNLIPNYAADSDEIMASLGFAFVAENPVTTLAAAAAAGVPPVTSIRESSGPTDLAIGAVADGQFLQRSGSALVGGSGGSFDMRDVFVFDHFMSGNVDTDEIGLMGWRLYGTGTGNGIAFTGLGGCPGVLIINGGTAAAARCAIALGEASLGGKVVLAGPAPIRLEFLFRFPTAADFSILNLESMIMGFGLDWAGDAEQTEGLFVRYAPLAPMSDTTYKLVSVTGGVATVLASTLAPAAGVFNRFTIVYTPSTGRATLEINGTPIAGDISTNIPVGGLGVGMKMRTVGSGTQCSGQWCYVLGTQDIN